MIWHGHWRALKFVLFWGGIVLLGVLDGLEDAGAVEPILSWPVWKRWLVVVGLGYGGIIAGVLMHFLGPVLNFIMTLFGKPLFYDDQIF